MPFVDKATRRAYMARYYDTHRERFKEYGAKSRVARRKKLRVKSAAHYAANREWYRDQSLRNNYGITTAEYDQKLAAQGGLCALCGEPPKPRRRLNVDHDHTTDAVRDLLCTRCNTRLSGVEDETFLARASAYLRRHRTASAA